MDIKIKCRACERVYPISMATDPETRPGHCPFCGEVLAFQYPGTFVDAAERVMGLGKEFEHQVQLLAELAGGFALDEDSVLVPVKEAIRTQDKLISEPYESRWPPKPPAPIGK